LTNPGKNSRGFVGPALLTDWKLGRPRIVPGEFQGRKYNHTLLVATQVGFANEQECQHALAGWEQV
jgi:hypothetical protein